MRFSPVAAAVAAAVSAVESANHQRKMRTTSTWTQKTWRPRSKQSRMEEVSLLGRRACFDLTLFLFFFKIVVVELILQFDDVANSTKDKQ